MTKAPSLKQVIMFHASTIEEQGGEAGLRDEGLLDAAISAPFQTFGEQDLFPSLIEKAARLAFGILKNHPFIDGNKRIGMYVMIAFLEVNGIPINAGNEDVTRVGLALGDGSMKYDELLHWIHDKQIV